MVTSPRASARGVPPVPVDWHSGPEHRRKLAETINRVLQGKTNTTGTVTLTANQATTAVTDLRAGPDSHISFTPTTANAAAALAGMYVSSRGNETFTLTHANNAQTDRTFTYSVTG